MAYLQYTGLTDTKENFLFARQQLPLLQLIFFFLS